METHIEVTNFLDSYRGYNDHIDGIMYGESLKSTM